MQGASKDPIVIRLPLTPDAVEFAKYVIRGMLMSLPKHEDRLWVVKDICHLCGSIARVCECQGVKENG